MPISKLSSSAELPTPRLVKGSSTWYIEYYVLKSGKEPRRVRKSFNLNRIHNLPERERKAQEILGTLTNRTVMTLAHGMEYALSLKLQSDREYTRITYRSVCGIFMEWAREHHYADERIEDFGRVQAQRFLDYVLIKRKVGNRTHNNYILNLRSLFYELVKRGSVKENPFAKMAKRKEVRKMRVPFNEKDRETVAMAVYDRHPQLYLAIMLICYCGIRVAELRRLRIRDIDLKRGLVTMGGDQTKNKELAFITIPKRVIPVIESYALHKYPEHYFIFGEGKKLQPHPDKACGRNTINARHREILQDLEKSGAIPSRKGLSAYSWKDTGGIALVRAGVDILTLRAHFRHKELRTTQVYLEQLGIVNKDIRNLDVDLMALPGKKKDE